jgi:hypothetical protein
LYLIKTPIKHPTHHNNHPDKTLLAPIGTLLQNCTTPISLHKVETHAKIVGNEETNKLVISGNKLIHLNPFKPYEFAYSTPYWFCKYEWPSMLMHPYKEPIKFL